MPAELPEKKYRTVQRVITTHDPDGKATFETGIKEEVDWERTDIGCDFFLAYTLGSFPAPLTNDADLNEYREHLVSHPPFMIPEGAVVRYVDYHPGCEPMWHRTVTLDFGIVVEGELELELESGEKRLLRRGDIAVQRGTSHCWRNPSKTEFARALYIAMGASPVVVNGEPLTESLGLVKH